MYEYIDSLTPDEIHNILVQSFVDGIPKLINNNKPHFTDSEILNFKDPIDDLRSILKLEWIIQEQLNSKDRRSVMYCSEENDKLICFTYGKDSFVVLLRSEYYVIFGIMGNCPMMDSNYFTYANSFRSGFDMFENQDNFTEPKLMVYLFIKYYCDFMCNNCH